MLSRAKQSSISCQTKVIPIYIIIIDGNCELLIFCRVVKDVDCCVVKDVDCCVFTSVYIVVSFFFEINIKFTEENMYTKLCQKRGETISN